MSRTRVDLHVKVLDGAVARRAKARGIDVLVYAPHFTRLPTIRQTARRYSDDDLLVVPAREVFTGSWRDRKHVLAVGISDPIPDFIGLEETMADLADRDAATLVPHPDFLTVSLSRPELERYRDVVDGVEIYNPKHLPPHNRTARRLAGDLDLPAFGSSYAHLPGTVGEVWTEFDTAIETADDLVAALRSGAERTVKRRSGLSHQARCAVEFAHLGYENTYAKIDRVLLSGMEPTHPDHIAYDGSFDDASVY
ncbi:MAG: PHP-associated domain-containing protein [Halanaeroarchaeum sp.]